MMLDAVRQLLVREGYEVQTAVSGEEALKLVRRHGLPHLMIVDLKLPGMDGFELIRTVQQFSDIPAIMLTAVADETVIVAGLSDCLEDYVTKPFKTAVLLSRIKRVLRRMNDYGYIQDPIVFVDIDLQIDLPNRKAIIDHGTVSLSPTEARLLHILMSNAGRTVSYDFLLRRLWPRDMAIEERLHTNIYRLRKKLERNPKKPRYICSHWGTGYVFNWGNSG